MAIIDSQKVDFLWKKIQFGVTETDITGKLGSNETIPSPVPTYSKDIWAQAESIPVPAAVIPLITEFITIQCTSDPTVAGNKTWLATKTFNTLNTLSGDWIPPTFDPSYLLAVFNGNPSSGGQPLNSTAAGNEWVFDYVAGTLHFPNTNAGVTQVWIRGYRYIGDKGLTGGSVGAGTITSQYANIAARNADDKVKPGQFALVLDNGDGEYAIYVANAAGPTSAWTLVSTKDSAEADAKSIYGDVLFSDTTVLLGNASIGRKALSISVDVTTVFDGTPSLTVGTSANQALLLDTTYVDLATIGLYEVTSNYKFVNTVDTVLNAYIAGGGTTGAATVTVNFL